MAEKESDGECNGMQGDTKDINLDSYRKLAKSYIDLVSFNCILYLFIHSLKQ